MVVIFLVGRTRCLISCSSTAAVPNAFYTRQPTVYELHIVQQSPREFRIYIQSVYCMQPGTSSGIKEVGGQQAQNSGRMVESIEMYCILALHLGLTLLCYVADLPSTSRLQTFTSGLFVVRPSRLITVGGRSLGPFYGAIAVPSVTRCRCRCRGHRCAGGVRQ